MSLNIEKQSLSTLKEWAQLLGIRGISTLRKPEMVDLLNRVGESRIEKALVIQAEKQAESGKQEAPPAEEKEAAAPAPHKRGRPRKVTAPAEAQAPQPAATEEAPAEQPEEEATEKPGGIRAILSTEKRDPNETKPYRKRLSNSYASTTPQTTTRPASRGGFGSYAPSYRAQVENSENGGGERPSRPRNLYERASAFTEDEERPSYRVDEENYFPRSEREPAYTRADRQELPAAKDPIPENPEKGGSFPSALAGPAAEGILEVLQEGYGFIRCENYMPGDNDVYVSPAQIHRFSLKTGDMLNGITKIKSSTEKFPALLYINSVNGEEPEAAARRKPFEDLTPIFPNERIHLETTAENRAMRIMDLLAPIGKGQRGMIVSPPKAGKTTLLKQVAKAVTANHPEMELIILLIDERPEEVTDIREEVAGPNVEVIYSTFDETPEHHKRVAEMVLGRAQRIVEHGRDVMILLDSITRLARAYNLTVSPSGRTLSGGLDPAALQMPKKFFGAARNMREGGSLTILATALVDTGSRLDDMVYEEFKGTGNMELHLDRKLSERRIFPAIDMVKSGTRRDDLLLTPEEQETVAYVRQALTNPVKGDESVEKILDLMRHTRTNRDFCVLVRKIRF